MLVRECSLDDCSMQQDPQPKRPMIRALYTKVIQPRRKFFN